MNKVGIYDNYRNSYQSYDVTAQSKTQRSTASVSKAGETSALKQADLSDEAKNLLKELQQKYGDTDFIVADYETDEEAAAYLARGTKDYSVLISSEELEAMAKDESLKNENLDKIESARTQLDDIKLQLKESGENVTKLGISFGKDGSTSLFASLEEIGKQQKERMEEAREAKQAEKAAERNKPYENVKRTTVTANTAEELLEKIRGVDWNKVEEEKVPGEGGRFDYFG